MTHTTDTQLLAAINKAVNSPVAQLLANRKAMVEAIKNSPEAMASWESVAVTELDIKWVSRIRGGVWSSTDIRTNIEQTVDAFLEHYLLSHAISYDTKDGSVVELTGHVVDDKTHYCISSYKPTDVMRKDPITEYHTHVNWGYTQAMYKRCMGPWLATHTRSPFGLRSLAELNNIHTRPGRTQ